LLGVGQQFVADIDAYDFLRPEGEEAKGIASVGALQMDRSAAPTVKIAHQAMLGFHEGRFALAKSRDVGLDLRAVTGARGAIPRIAIAFVKAAEFGRSSHDELGGSTTAPNLRVLFW
jgi:hypothetical protein